MSETKSTPGPWNVPDFGHCPVLVSAGSAGSWDGMIASVDAGDYARSRDEGQANARLIAAAPDLLALALQIVTRLGPLHGDITVHFEGRCLVCDTRRTLYKATGDESYKLQEPREGSSPVCDEPGIVPAKAHADGQGDEADGSGEENRGVGGDPQGIKD